MALALVACPALVPKATGSIPNMSFAHGDMDARTVSDLGRYFDEDTNAKYSAESSAKAVADASVTDTTLTVTPKGPGTATVTVTATAPNGRDSANQTFTVTVASPPANTAPEVRTINNVSLDVGDVHPVNLANYASDADGDTLTLLGALSSDTNVATVSHSGLVVTVTAVGGGQATIGVRITDGKSTPVDRTFDVVVAEPSPDNRPPVLLTSSLIPHITAADNFRIDDTRPYNLSGLFQDPDADDLMYGAESADSSVASITGLDADTGMFTLTAEGQGNTSVTVKATDPDGLSAQQTFNVVVGSKPPMKTTASTDVDLEQGASREINLNDYFKDDLGETLMYALGAITGEMYVMATLPEGSSMLTITAKEAGAGEATVTVSAKDSDNDAVELTFDVTVMAMPTPPPTVQPPTIADGMETPNTVMLERAGAKSTAMITLTDYFDGDSLMFSADSNNEAVATESISDDGVMTITAVAPGGAVITVMATNSAGSESLRFNVTVATNRMPVVKMMLPDITRNANADNVSINLHEYFEDPDGSLLLYSAKVVKDSEKPVTSGLSVIALSPTVAGASTALPSGLVSKATLVIDIENPGEAMVEVMASDNQPNSEAAKGTFKITVLPDDTIVAPVGAAGTIVDVDGDPATTRLKIGDEAKKAIDDQLINTFFTDADFDDPDEGGDMLRFTVKYYAAETFTAGPITQAVLEAATAITDTTKHQVMESLSKTTWDGNSTDKFTLSLTAVNAGTAVQQVALIATDKYEQSAAVVFEVRVNHKPKAEGAQKTPLMLSSATKFDDDSSLLNMASTGGAKMLTIVENKKGYFSDGDGPEDLAGAVGTAAAGRWCEAERTFSGTKAPAAVGYERAGAGDEATLKLTITPSTGDDVAYGPMTISVRCKDAANEWSGTGTLRIHVKDLTGGSIQ